MLRRLAQVQPEGFAFTPANLEWARAQMTKYPEGRQQSAIIPVMWRAHEQEGWLSRPAIEYCADLLGMAHIRALEVATFYFMFKLEPVGSVAHIQICGTTTCMICGAEDLIRVCREKIAPHPFQLSPDGRFSWEEVECLGACANAPMAQIGKDYYEDLSAERLAGLIDAMAAGQVPVPGPQDGRFSSEAKGGDAVLTEVPRVEEYNASVAFAVRLGETLKRIDGTEVPILTKWLGGAHLETPPDETDPEAAAQAERTSDAAARKGADDAAKADHDRVESAGDREREALAAAPGRRPEGLAAAREGGGDDLKVILGVGPALEQMLHGMGIWHFDQIAAWGDDELAWVDQNLEGFRGRASRDRWIEQARLLADGGSPEAAAAIARKDEG